MLLITSTMPIAYYAPSSSDPPIGSDAVALNFDFGFQEDVIVEVDAKVSGEAPDGIDEWGIFCAQEITKITI